MVLARAPWIRDGLALAFASLALLATAPSRGAARAEQAPDWRALSIDELVERLEGRRREPRRDSERSEPRMPAATRELCCVPPSPAGI